MIFSMSFQNLINLIAIAVGIGVCALCLLQISSSVHLRKIVRQFFQFFFSLLLLYISTHLTRQLMEGIPGRGVRVILYAVTFAEMLAAGLMAHMMSMLVLSVTRPEKVKQIEMVLHVLILVHGLVLIVGCFNGMIYYYDADNLYHRGALYLLSNLSPLAMLIINLVLLARHGKAVDKRIRNAFLIYLIAPVAAIVIQSFTYGIQYIIIATIGAAVYMFFVIIQQQTEEYEKQRMESSRLETELSMASSIQADMLPNIFPAFPEREEFDIYASMDAAKEVGGDFYDYFFVDDSHLGMVMADVSGKGVPAALFMMVSKIVIQQYTLQSLSPKAALEIANRTICANNREEMFVTVWLGVLDIDTGKLTAANAGHEYPVIGRAGKGFSLLNDKHGLVIGAFEHSKYREYEVQLEPGDTVFLYTDGVPEATNASEELYGTERMLAALNRSPGAEPDELLKNLRADVDAFVGDAPQFDDLTMLALRYNGSKKESDPNRVNFADTRD